MKSAHILATYRCGASGMRWCAALGLSLTILAPVHGALSTATWDGSTGIWSDGSHWSTSPNFPNNGTPAGATYDAVINSGSVTLNQDISIQKFTLTGGTLTGAAATNFTLTLNDLFSWTGGTLSGPGTVNATVGITLSGSNTKTISERALINGGITNFSGGTLSLFGGGTFINNGTFNATDGAEIGNNGGLGGNGFSNSATGIFNKTGAATTTVIHNNVAFNNAHNVNVNSGTLQINGGGSSTGGTFSVANSATLAFAGGIYTANASTSLNNSGLVTFSNVASNTTVSLNGPYSGAGEVQVNGTSGGATTVNFNAAATIQTLTITGGTFAGSGSVNIPGGGTLNWTGGTIGGSGSFTVASTAAFNLTSVNEKTLSGRALTNNATTDFSGGNLSFAIDGIPSAFINNGTFNAKDEADLGNNGAFSGHSFSNSATGVFNKTGAATTTIIHNNVAFNNAGAVNVNSGTLQINGGGSSTGGTFSVANGATLAFAGGTYTANASTSLANAGLVSFSNVASNTNVSLNGPYSGAGEVQVNGTSGGATTVSFNAAATIQTLTITGGTFAGSGAVNIPSGGALNWTGGTIGGSGSFSVASTATFNISSVNGKTLIGRTVTDNAITDFSGGNLTFAFDGPTPSGFVNNGTFNAKDNAGFVISGFGGHTFSNSVTGIFNKTGATTTTVISDGVAFNNAGAVNVNSGTLALSNYTQTAGTTRLAGGSLTTSTLITIVSGSLSGTGTITGNVNNSGTISPGLSAGTLTINGNLSLTSSSVLDFELAAANVIGGPNDLLNTGNLSLDGTLAVTALGGFTDGIYTIIDYTGSLTDNGLVLQSSFLAAHPGAVIVNDAVNTRINLIVVPEPTTEVLLGLMGSWLAVRRRRLTILSEGCLL